MSDWIDAHKTLMNFPTRGYYPYLTINLQSTDSRLNSSAMDSEETSSGNNKKMKTPKVRLAIAALACVCMSAMSRADTLYFNAEHNTGTAVQVYVDGDVDDAGNGGSATPYAPASEVWVEYINDGYPGSSELRALIDTTYAVGTYYIGTIPGGGADCYVNIN